MVEAEIIYIPHAHTCPLCPVKNLGILASETQEFIVSECVQLPNKHQNDDVFEYSIFEDHFGQTKIGDFNEEVKRSNPTNKLAGIRPKKFS